MIAITVNGQAREVAEGSTLADLVAELAASPKPWPPPSTATSWPATFAPPTC